MKSTKKPATKWKESEVVFRKDLRSECAPSAWYGWTKDKKKVYPKSYGPFKAREFGPWTSRRVKGGADFPIPKYKPEIRIVEMENDGFYELPPLPRTPWWEDYTDRWGASMEVKVGRRWIRVVGFDFE